MTKVINLEEIREKKYKSRRKFPGKNMMVNLLRMTKFVEKITKNDVLEEIINGICKCMYAAFVQNSNDNNNDYNNNDNLNFKN